MQFIDSPEIAPIGAAFFLAAPLGQALASRQKIGRGAPPAPPKWLIFLK